MRAPVTDKRIVLTLLLTLHLLIIPFLLNSGLSYENYYLAVLLTISSVYFYIRLRESPLDSDQILGRADWFLLLGILIIPSLLAALHLHGNSIWLDEYEELLNIVNYPDLLHQTATFQQPPLSYFIRRLGIIFFGQNELGLRISSVIGNTLFLLVMYFNIRKITKDLCYSFLCTLLLGFNYWIILYSVEARPYSISLFYFAVFLHFLLSEMTNSRNFVKLGLIFTTLFWLLSISMQPLIFVSWAALAALISWLFCRQAKYLAVSTAFIVALLLNLPFLMLIVSVSQRYIQTFSRPFGAYFVSCYNDLFLVKSMFLNNYFYYLIILQMFILIAVSLFAGKKHRLWIQAGAGFSILYLFIIIFLFEYKINWQLTTRYLITTVPIFYLLFAFAFFHLRGDRFVKLKRAVLLQLVLVALASYLYTKPFQAVGRNWRGLYSNVDKLTDGSGKAFYFSFFGTASGWTDEFFIGPELYASSKVLYPPMSMFSFPTFTSSDYLYSQFGDATANSELFFIISRSDFRESDFEKLNIRGTEKLGSEGFYIIKANPPTSTLTLAKEFFAQLDRISDETEIKLHAYDGLFLAALFEKNCTDLKKYLEKFAAVAEKLPVYDPKIKLHRMRYRSQCGESI